jgi:hypothetical protein
MVVILWVCALRRVLFSLVNENTAGHGRLMLFSQAASVCS